MKTVAQSSQQTAPWQKIRSQVFALIAGSHLLTSQVHAPVIDRFSGPELHRIQCAVLYNAVKWWLRHW